MQTRDRDQTSKPLNTQSDIRQVLIVAGKHNACLDVRRGAGFDLALIVV